MFDQFTEYVAKAPQDEVRALLVEDIALCVTHFQVQTNGSGAREELAGLQNAMNLWIAEFEPPNHESEGSRQQPVLRALIDDLQAGQVARLERDELDFLAVVRDLIQRAHRPEAFDRLSTVLTPHMDGVLRRRSETKAADGLRGLARRGLRAEARWPWGRVLRRPVRPG